MFGVEIELNSFDQRDFVAEPLNGALGELPQGINKIAEEIQKAFNFKVEVSRWKLNHNNQNWVIKPDRSCGMELCTPVSVTWEDLKNICMVVEKLKTIPEIKTDNRCSVHVHIDVRDCSEEEVAKILSYWIKCESVFLDSVAKDRKRNRYCQCIGMTDLFSHDDRYSPSEVIAKLGTNKYYTANTYHFVRGNRRTLEFRIIGMDGCLDPYLIKNWVRLLVHFVEMSLAASWISPYRKGDSWSSLLWLNPKEVMEHLGFYGGPHELSPGMEETRNWFLARLNANVTADLPGIWSPEARQIAKKEIEEIVDSLCLINLSEWLHPSDERRLYSDMLKI